VTRQASLLNGPDLSPEPIGDVFDEMAAIAVARALRPGAGLYGDDVKRMRIEVARMMRKAYVYGQTGVHPAHQDGTVDERG